MEGTSKSPFWWRGQKLQNMIPSIKISTVGQKVWLTFGNFIAYRHQQICTSFKSFFFTCRPYSPTFIAHLNYFQHLFAAYVPVSIQVIHTKSPLQLLFQLPSGCDTQGDDELPEVYRPIGVGVKSSKDVLSKLGGISIGKEIGIDLLEFLHIQGSTGAIFQETLKKKQRKKAWL